MFGILIFFLLVLIHEIYREGGIARHHNIPAKYNCDNNLTSCETGCSDLTKDPKNCGVCGKICPQGQICSNSSCQYDTQNDILNCGKIGNICTDNSNCVSGNCTCKDGYSDCGGKCVNFANDKYNCGSCNNKCDFDKICSGGKCICDIGKTLCSYGCTDLQNNLGGDLNGCGNCDTHCPEGKICKNGSCQCQDTANTDSTGKCIPKNDNNNCITLGTKCPAGTQCCYSPTQSGCIPTTDFCVNSYI